MSQRSAAHRSFGDRVRRLFSTAEQLEAEDLEERSLESGAEHIAGAAPRSRVKFRGTVTSLTTAPDSGWLEAVLNDGTGTVKLVWMGHHRLECVVPGSDLLVSGRLAGDDGAGVIYNPEFEVVS